MIEKVFRQMTVTQIVSAITVTVCLMIDSVVIGRLLGVTAMGAYGLANPLIIVFNALGIMMTCGVQILTGKAMGRGNLEECRECFSTSVVMSLAMAAVWIIVIFGATKPLCIMLGAGVDEELLDMTGSYLRGYMIGAPFFFLSQIEVPYMQAMGKRRLTMVSVIVMTVTDIVFDIVNVCVFNAGMFGVGLASSLSYAAAVLVGIVYFASKDCPFRFEKKALHLSTAGAIAHGGSPVLVNQAFFMIRVYVLNIIMLKVSGTLAVAALSVISTIGNFVFSIGLGAGAISLMLSSIFYSEGDRTSLYELVRVMIDYTSKLIAAVVVIILITAPWLIGLFLGGDPEVLGIAIPGMRLYIISLIPCVLNTVLKNYYQGTRRMMFTNIISFCDNTGLFLPVVLLFSMMMGLTGAWIGIILGQTSSLIMISIVVWIRYGRISFSAEAYSMLDDDFGANPEDVFELSVTDLTAAVSASEDVFEFCKAKQMNGRLSYMVSLYVEEVLVNIIDHGFTKDELPHSADLRIVVDETSCIIRIRDNCKGFDPTSYLKLHSSDDPSRHIGIRIITGLENDIDYINSLGLNNLYIRINKA